MKATSTLLCLLFLWAASNTQAQVNQLENMGPNINSDRAESSPVITPTGEVLYFWSLDRPDGLGFHDIYYSLHDPSGTQFAQMKGSDTTGLGAFMVSLNQSHGWGRARNAGTPLNDAQANIVLSITPDGNSLLIYKESKQAGESDLAVSRRISGAWTPPKALKITDFQNLGGTSLTAHLCADGKTLLISMRSGSNDDLFVSFLGEGGQWSAPKSLGNILNTNGDEITPFLAPDGISLYFSSNGMGGEGASDIFLTRRLDDTWTNWSPPRNLGKTVNTAGDDYYFKFPLQADYGYLVSTGASQTFGNKDIYRVRLPEDVKPTPVFRVKGIVKNKQTGAALGAKITYLRLKDGAEMGTATSDPVTGAYELLLPAGERYTILADGSGYVAMSEFLDGTAARNFQLIPRDLLLVPLATGETITLNNLFFDSGKSTIRPESYPELNRIVRLLANNPRMTIEVTGHTDNIGTDQANLYFSNQRAAAVVEYLKQQGIDPSRLKSAGRGSSKPVAPNTTEEGRQKNRRVEVQILTAD